MSKHFTIVLKTHFHENKFANLIVEIQYTMDDIIRQYWYLVNIFFIYIILKSATGPFCVYVGMGVGNFGLWHIKKTSTFVEKQCGLNLIQGIQSYCSNQYQWVAALEILFHSDVLFDVFMCKFSKTSTDKFVTGNYWVEWPPPI